MLISALSIYLPPVLWAWIRAPATHFLGARILTTLTTSTPPAAFSALLQHLPSPFSVIVLSSQYLFQRGPIWIRSGSKCILTLFAIMTEHIGGDTDYVEETYTHSRSHLQPRVLDVYSSPPTQPSKDNTAFLGFPKTVGQDKPSCDGLTDRFW